jgi:hypothetical protein
VSSVRREAWRREWQEVSEGGGSSGQGGVVIGNAASGRRVCRRVGAAVGLAW